MKKDPHHQVLSVFYNWWSQGWYAVLVLGPIDAETTSVVVLTDIDASPWGPWNPGHQMTWSAEDFDGGFHTDPEEWVTL